MNFDDIQSAWNSDSENKNIKVPTNLEQLKTANMPLDRIRKNMRLEIITQLLAIVFIGILPFKMEFNPKFITPFYMLYGVMILISIYYFTRFYFFYKRIDGSTLNSKENLFAVYYDIKLNIEMYKSFAYSLLPFAFCFLIMIMMSLNGREKFGVLGSEMTENGMIIFVVLILALLGMIVAATEIWVRYYYGKYAKQIKNLLDQLKDE
ncbi:hypothetical protein [Flavobacterium sp. '19STA2R22 D10 B1']|uniref:hypothetical protein n=1 Tax=Flavobacterium aerium TaxID=3037261 RepID=UPI00278C4C28|nr:hypothetical protein [Flavobacterium sp. '19STA2R22 D10 B1']